MLMAMRRRHTREDYLRLIDRVRHAIPSIQLSTDVIVGFPGESSQDFEDTLNLVREVGFHSMYSFKYSPRPNTVAAKRLEDDVSSTEKTVRIVALQEQQREIQQALHSAMVGTTVEVLIDSASRRRDHEISGRTTGNTIVNCPGAPGQIGRMLRITIERAGPNSVWGMPAGQESGNAN
jgi:tRNA-2-methylthio-N6-dimethylallyladenosine synthase